jgi:anti-sigma B factor antagonist
MAPGSEAEPNFRVTTTRGPAETLTLTVRGELDIVTAPGLGEALDDAINASAGDLELDLRECSFVDSRGLQVIIEGGRSLVERGRSLRLENPQQHVRRLFLTAGIDRIAGLQLEDDAPEPPPTS